MYQWAPSTFYLLQNERCFENKYLKGDEPMISPAEAREILNHMGIYARKVSEQANIRYSYLSEWLCGKRNFTNDELARLDAYFDKLKRII